MMGYTATVLVLCATVWHTAPIKGNKLSCNWSWAKPTSAVSRWMKVRLLSRTVLGRCPLLGGCWESRLGVLEGSWTSLDSKVSRGSKARSCLNRKWVVQASWWCKGLRGPRRVWATGSRTSGPPSRCCSRWTSSHWASWLVFQGHAPPGKPWPLMNQGFGASRSCANKERRLSRVTVHCRQAWRGPRVRARTRLQSFALERDVSRTFGGGKHEIISLWSADQRKEAQWPLTWQGTCLKSGQDFGNVGGGSETCGG